LTNRRVVLDFWFKKGTPVSRKKKRKGERDYERGGEPSQTGILFLVGALRGVINKTGLVPKLREVAQNQKKRSGHKGDGSNGKVKKKSTRTSPDSKTDPRQGGKKKSWTQDGFRRKKRQGGEGQMRNKRIANDCSACPKLHKRKRTQRDSKESP